LKAEDIYKPLSLVGTAVATNLAPFKRTPGMKIEQKNKPRREIGRAIRQMKENVENPGLPLYIPYEWWVSECGALLLKQTADEVISGRC
jgi:hypothetical protein